MIDMNEFEITLNSVGEIAGMTEEDAPDYDIYWEIPERIARKDGGTLQKRDYDKLNAYVRSYDMPHNISIFFMTNANRDAVIFDSTFC